MQTILITGGSGLIGRELTKQLIAKGYAVIILTRSKKEIPATANVRYAYWDITRNIIDIKALQLADFIVHLAGSGVVDKRWTATYKKEILESRTLGSKLILDTLKQHSNQVKAIISASAIGWYGPDKANGHFFVETDPHADDFLGQTCFAWEHSLDEAASMNIRTAKLRTGIVLSNDGGALSEFKKPLRFGIAAILGSGKQIISWIHMDDLCRLYIHAIEDQTFTGSYNAVSNVPVSNKELTLTLAKATRGSYFIPVHVPAFILKLILGESSIEVLKSATVSNSRIKETGFTFLYPTLHAALETLVGKKL